MELVLSLFPGADYLGRGFAAEGFCVVRGPDLILDERIEDWHAVPGRFDGVIAGPPCQHYSDANRQRDAEEGDRLLRECLRAIKESRPEWFLIENVRHVPTVQLSPYHVQRLDIRQYEIGGRQKRLRHIQFGSRINDIIRPARTNTARSVTARQPAVLTRAGGSGSRHGRRATAQGLRLPLRSFTKTARARLVGNAVPYDVARALARSVTARSGVTDEDCICLCGRRITPPAKHATAACRKRMQRRREGKVRTLTLELDHAPQRDHGAGPVTLELGHVQPSAANSDRLLDAHPA